jgi:hypothetical protein
LRVKTESCKVLRPNVAGALKAATKLVY